MTLTNIITLDKKLKWTLGQGHKVKGQGQIYNFVKKSFGYLSWTNDWILLTLGHMDNIYKMLNLTLGQGHKIKGQCQICNHVKTFFLLCILNVKVDLDDT